MARARECPVQRADVHDLTEEERPGPAPAVRAHADERTATSRSAKLSMPPCRLFLQALEADSPTPDQCARGAVTSRRDVRSRRVETAKFFPRCPHDRTRGAALPWRFDR